MCGRGRSNRSSPALSPPVAWSTRTSMPSTLTYPPGATSTRRSATGAASMRAMRTAAASARCTSTAPLRASGRCCAPGCARTAASRKTSCSSISTSSSSCTTHTDAAKPCSEPSSPPWSHDPTSPPRNPIRAKPEKRTNSAHLVAYPAFQPASETVAPEDEAVRTDNRAELRLQRECFITDVEEAAAARDWVDIDHDRARIVDVGLSEAEQEHSPRPHRIELPVVERGRLSGEARGDQQRPSQQR